MYTLTPEQSNIQSIFEEIKPFLSEKAIAFMDTQLPDGIGEVDKESSDLHVSYWGYTFVITHTESLEAHNKGETINVPTQHSLKKMARMINKLVENDVVEGGVFLKEKVAMMPLTIVSPAFRYIIIFYAGTKVPNSSLRARNRMFLEEGELPPHWLDKNGLDFIMYERRKQNMIESAQPDKYSGNDLLSQARAYMDKSEVEDPEHRLNALGIAGAYIAAEMDRIIKGEE